MREKIYYFIFGVLTVVINLTVFLILIYFWNVSDDYFMLTLVNFIAFMIAILFAYYTNTVYVFNNVCSISNCIKFISARIFTLFIESIGLSFIVFINGNVYFGKYGITFLVVILNYMLSKYWIYKEIK